MRNGFSSADLGNHKGNIMSWNLFLDDERDPKDVFWAPKKIRDKYAKEQWTIARSKVEVAEAIAKHGSLPTFISFDHDLGEFTANGYEVMRWLVSIDMGEKECAFGKIPENFAFYVHSQNPIGARNIESYLSQYLEKRHDLAR